MLMAVTILILAAIGSEIGKFLIGCLIFGGVIWVGMLIGQRNDDIKRLKRENEELTKKQKYHDAHIRHLQKKAYPDEEE